jgi:hypothetical protein
LIANFKKDNAGASLAWEKIMIVDKEWIKEGVPSLLEHPLF